MTPFTARKGSEYRKEREHYHIENLTLSIMVSTNKSEGIGEALKF